MTGVHLELSLSLPADIRLCENILTVKRHLKPIYSNLLSPPVLHQAPLYLRT